jgi:uncharacterized protein
VAVIAMNPRISVVTLGVNDLEASLAFYRDGLGLPTTGIVGTEFKGGGTCFCQSKTGPFDDRKQTHFLKSD